METMVLTIGITLIKMGVLGGLGSGIIAGVKWFGKYDPKFKGNTGGNNNESDAIENLRKAVRH